MDIAQNRAYQMRHERSVVTSKKSGLSPPDGVDGSVLTVGGKLIRRSDFLLRHANATSPTMGYKRNPASMGRHRSGLASGSLRFQGRLSPKEELD